MSEKKVDFWDRNQDQGVGVRTVEVLKTIRRERKRLVKALKKEGHEEAAELIRSLPLLEKEEMKS